MAGRSGLGVGPTGLDIFGRACLSADIVKTFAKLIKLHPPPRSYRKEIYMTQYAAFASLRHLLAASKGIDRRILVDQMVAHGMYDVLTEVSTFNPASSRTHFERITCIDTRPPSLHISVYSSRDYRGYYPWSEQSMGNAHKDDHVRGSGDVNWIVQGRSGGFR